MANALSYVQPGDLITAEFINQIVDAIAAASVDAGQFYDQITTLVGAISDLETRVAAIEQTLGSPPKGKDTKDTKETKETKDTKESKETKELVLDKIRIKDAKDTKEGKETKEVLQDKVRIKETIADRKVVAEKTAIVDSVRQRATEQVGDEASALIADREPVQHFIPSALRPDLSLSALIAEDSGGVR